MGWGGQTSKLSDLKHPKLPKTPAIKTHTYGTYFNMKKANLDKNSLNRDIVIKKFTGFSNSVDLLLIMLQPILLCHWGRTSLYCIIE